MKTYTATSEINWSEYEFEVNFASAVQSGYGHKKITVEIAFEGNYKKFEATTNNMPAYDEACEFEGQEKTEALFEVVESQLESYIADWIFDLKDSSE